MLLAVYECEDVGYASSSQSCTVNMHTFVWRFFIRIINYHSFTLLFSVIHIYICVSLQIMCVLAKYISQNKQTQALYVKELLQFPLENNNVCLHA